MFLIDPEFRRFVHADAGLDPVMLQEVWGLLATLGAVDVVADGWGLEHPDELTDSPGEFSMRVKAPSGLWAEEHASVRGGGSEFWVSGGTSPRVHAQLRRLVEHVESWPGVQVHESHGAYVSASLERRASSSRGRHASASRSGSPAGFFSAAWSPWSVVGSVLDAALRVLLVVALIGALTAAYLAPDVDVFFTWVHRGATLLLTAWGTGILGVAVGVGLVEAVRRVGAWWAGRRGRPAAAGS